MTDTCRTEFKTAKLFDSTLPHGGCAAHELSGNMFSLVMFV